MTDMCVNRGWIPRLLCQAGTLNALEEAEIMVLGRSRVKTSPAFPRALTSHSGDWRFSAGTPIYEASVDLDGAFPGYVERGSRAEHVRLSVYDHGLTIDEGKTNGFYLSFDQIIATDDLDFASEDDQMLRIRYREGDESRLFTLRLRSPRLVIRGSGNRKTSKLRTILNQLEVRGGPVDDLPDDAFLTSWGETDAFGGEAMVWHGHASASILLTGERIPCDVFITSKSIVWGKDARSPISRVPLASIRDVTPGHASGKGHPPAAYVGIGDSQFDRVEFPFVFDSYENSDRNALERSAFIVHLRSRKVALTHPQAPDQPWMRAPMVEQQSASIWPAGVTAIRVQQDLSRPVPIRQSDDVQVETPSVPSFRDPVARLRPDRGVITAHDWSYPGEAVKAWPSSVLPLAQTVNGVAAEEPIAEEDRLLSEFSPPESPVAGLGIERTVPLPVDDPVRAYEADALASLHDVLDVVRRREKGDKKATIYRRPPSGAALTTALESVVDRLGRNELDQDQATSRKLRLIALDDAARRLDVLLPLHANGAISIQELRNRTDALCHELSAALFASSR
jgi:hypothetical protein